ncbi:FAD-linked oxidase C-terminal domain-containing protein [Bradyrhizobium sp. Arg816]|uniref:FAD-linked oxidase C-terminal domain-containing protein n=1 Tax=Bradyrhizobium sp. Arg816 TaxID=2998491 RepID=UPI00249DEC71|nr:FAD-linked oxidase C-terminal domain-containing protein [Bradyrhizobium sp. Arg816]MDI3567186.1 hypothetical protein [Bradyrhizobium sp. Arg816]
MKAEMPARFPNVNICDFGPIGDGSVHFNLIPAKDDPRLADAAFEAALRELVSSVCVEEFQGTFSAEHVVGRKNQNVYDRYTPAEIRRLAAPRRGSSDRSLCEVAESETRCNQRQEHQNEALNGEPLDQTSSAVKDGAV